MKELVQFAFTAVHSPPVQSSPYSGNAPGGNLFGSATVLPVDGIANGIKSNVMDPPLPSKMYPICEQTAPASSLLLVQTVLHCVPFTHTSTRPSLSVDPPTSLRAPSVQLAVIYSQVNYSL